MGGGVLLQSLAVEHRFSTVIAESPFADFRDIAEYRVAQRMPFAGPMAYGFAKPFVRSGFLCARWRYGMDFDAASPADVVGNVSTPILLIHGLEDTNIPPKHSRVLASLNPKAITFVAGAGSRAHRSARDGAGTVPAAGAGVAGRPHAAGILSKVNVDRGT
jgi:fermentation-respiration switch protein FrsA (DUF1100 family)